jgi:hypothetical protein
VAVIADTKAVVFRTHGTDTASLSPTEFIGRFLQHILPKPSHKSPPIVATRANPHTIYQAHRIAKARRTRSFDSLIAPRPDYDWAVGALPRAG